MFLFCFYFFWGGGGGGGGGIFRLEIVVVNEIMLQYTKTFFPNRKYSPRSRESRTFTFLLIFNIEVGIFVLALFNVNDVMTGTRRQNGAIKCM